MAIWRFTTPVVAEGPASWGDRLFVRVKLNRGVSIFEGPPGTYRALRFPTQDEIAGASTAYMGGHEFVVTDDTRAALMAAGVGVTAQNFTAIEDGDMGISTVNGDSGPDVVLNFLEVGAARQITVRRAYVTSGNIVLPSSGGVFAPVTGLELPIPAAVGDYVELITSFMWQPVAASYLELGAIVGATIKRYSSTGTGTTATAGEGDPSLYPAPGTYRTSGAHLGFTVASGDLDTGNVRFIVAAKSGGAGDALYASANYPFHWTAKNYGPVL